MSLVLFNDLNNKTTRVKSVKKGNKRIASEMLEAPRIHGLRFRVVTIAVCRLASSCNNFVRASVAFRRTSWALLVLQAKHLRLSQSSPL